ncbi:MAG: zf-TFIIB domain-containing protein [Myxococcota bacterium]|nr:zf-TFIIB domain-containing protein [Myxococcota bacterium]
MTDERLGCPACRAPLDPHGARLFCAGCAGVMVTRDELAEMLRSIDPREPMALEERLTPLPAADRRCPRCETRMDAFALNHIPLDRCTSHGFWFDRDELAGVLQGRTSPASFALENEVRRFAADSFEVGSPFALLSRVWRAIRDRDQPDPEPEPAPKKP